MATLTLFGKNAADRASSSGNPLEVVRSRCEPGEICILLRWGIAVGMPTEVYDGACLKVENVLTFLIVMGT